MASTVTFVHDDVYNRYIDVSLANGQNFIKITNSTSNKIAVKSVKIYAAVLKSGSKCTWGNSVTGSGKAVTITATLNSKTATETVSNTIGSYEGSGGYTPNTITTLHTISWSSPYPTIAANGTGHVKFNFNPSSGTVFCWEKTDDKIDGTYTKAESEVTLAPGTGVSSFTVTYGSSSKTITSSTKITVEYGTVFTISAITFAAGYHAGDYNVNSTFTANSETLTKTITAVANTYTVAFNANGGSGTMSNLSCTYGTNTALTANSFTAPTTGGYAFEGWATSTSNASAGTVAYANSANIKTGTATNNGTVTLYAVWKRTVTFHNGANNSTSTDTQYYGGNLVIPNVTAITNWTSLGYRTDTTASTATYTAGTKAYTGGNTLYAVYSRTLTITYNGNGSTSGSTANTTKTVYLNANSTTTSSQSVTLATNGYSKTGYTPAGKWAEGSASGSQKTAGSIYDPAVAYNATTFGKTMYAVWTINQYSVTYNSNGSSATAPSEQTADYNSSITLADKIARSNDVVATYTITYKDGSSTTTQSVDKLKVWTFGGWNTNASGTGTNYPAKASFKIPASNTTLYANWSSSTSNPVASLTQLPNKSTGTPGTTSYKEYLFAGWDTKSDGTGTRYTTTITLSSNITLYAQYSDNMVTITYNKNGGNTNITQTIYSGSKPTLSDGSGMARSGYKLIGWNTKADGTGSKYLLGSNGYPSITANTTLYAVWYQNFSWTTNDTTNIAVNKPTTNATRIKCAELCENIANYIDETYVWEYPVIIIEGTLIESIADTLNISYQEGYFSEGSIAYAAAMNDIATAMNSNATYLGAI